MAPEKSDWFWVIGYLIGGGVSSVMMALGYDPVTNFTGIVIGALAYLLLSNEVNQ